ncbi:hypothetical protein YA24_17975 [Klebsiella aerogenes]|nr:hypothetical protein YA24_17975 [Klebsiella aerogenes]
MSRNPPQRRNARARNGVALQSDGSCIAGTVKAAWPNGRSKRAVDLSHQTLAVWPETRRGSAEPGRCAAAALAEWGSTTEQRS